MLPFASCISFGGKKGQTDFSSFMFHIQATSQQTLVFTPMLIKVNYFVVLGHWYKTCAPFSLCYVQKFTISRCIQHKLMTYLCFPTQVKAILVYVWITSTCQCQMPWGFLHDSFSLIFWLLPLWCQNLFPLSSLLDYNLLKDKVTSMRIYITNENSHLQL